MSKSYRTLTFLIQKSGVIHFNVKFSVTRCKKKKVSDFHVGEFLASL